MKNAIGKRLLSELLCICMLLSLFPAITLSASAADQVDSSNISSVSSDALSELGFNTDTSEFSGSMNASSSPTGPGSFALRTIPELLMSGITSTKETRNLYDYEDGGLDLAHAGATGNGSTKLLKTKTETNIALHKHDGDMFTKTLAFDPMGSGKDDHIAYLCASHSAKAGGSYDFTLYVVSQTDTVTVSYSLGTVMFSIFEYQQDCYMPLAAGDFDGDGCEELAVYHFSENSEHPWGTYESTDAAGGTTIYAESVSDNPAYTADGDSVYKLDASGDRLYLHNDDENLDIRILDVDMTAKEIKRHALSTAGGSTVYAEYNLSGIGYRKSDIGASASAVEAKQQYPVISLASVEQPGDEFDDLVICASAPLKSGVLVQDLVSRFVFWVDAGSATGAATQTFYGSWNYADDYGLSDSSKAERMAFAGAGSANLDGDADGANEVVVAGYRFYETSVTKNVPSDNIIDDGNQTEFYLAATYSYDAVSKAYVSDGPAIWINVDDDTYQDAINLNERVYSGFQDDEMAHPPLQVLAFAEKGAGYADSVFINGFVCDYYGSDGGVSSVPYAPDKNLKSAVVSKREKGFLYVSYAVPINFISYSSGDRDEDSDRTRWIGDAVAGNFDGDVSGMEELIFTYMRKTDDRNFASNSLGCAASATIVGVQKKAAGPLNDTDTKDLYNENLEIRAKGSNYDDFDIHNADFYNFTATDWYEQTKGNTLNLSAVDMDNDSVLVMPNPNKDPDYYFSDPYVVAILQSAPYFEELGGDNYSFYPSNGGTAIEKESGSTSATKEGFEISAGILFGVSNSISSGLFVNKTVLEEELTQTMSFNFSTSFSQEREKTYSTAYSASVGTDSVVLTMTPYVRYYYLVYDGENYSELSIDTPATPRTTMVSVETYDNVAKESGWEQIRGNILKSTPGDPSSYPSTENGLSGFDGGRTLGGNSGNNWIGVGTGGLTSVGNITQSISSTTTNGYEIESSLSTEIEMSVTAGGAKAGVSAGAGFTAGYSSASYEGTTFSGTVDSIPQQAAAGYDFLWRFGCWEDTLSYTSSEGRAQQQKVYVLGYLVKDVKSLPKPTQDLNVVDFTDSSITLEWTHPKVKPVSYIIYRQEAGGYVPLDIVRSNDSGSTQQYTDATCQSGEEYTYVVVSVRYQNGFETTGPNSPSATGKTLSADMPSVVIEGGKVKTLQTGDPITLTAAVMPVSGGKNAAVQWQRWNGEQYVNINGESKNSYTIRSVTEDLGGSRYRCYATQIVNGNWMVGYSVYTELNVTKRATIASLSTLADDTGSCSTVNENGVTSGGTEFSFNASVKEPDGTPVSGSVVFRISNTSTGGIWNLKSTLSGGAASARFTPSEAGLYNVSVSYLGSETHAASDSGDQAPFTVYTSEGNLLLITSGGELDYGDTLTLSASLLHMDGTRSPVTSAAYKVTDEGSFAAGSTSVDLTGNSFDPVAVSGALYSKRNNAAANIVRAAGAYQIQATCTVGGETYSTVKTVNVSKKPLKISIPDKDMHLSGGVSADYLDDLILTYDSFADEDMETIANYKKVFKPYTDTAYDELFVGEHPIKLLYAEQSASGLSLEQYQVVVTQLLSNYDVSYTGGVLRITDDWYTVTYSSSGNGTLAANTDSRATLPSSQKVLRNTCPRTARRARRLRPFSTDSSRCKRTIKHTALYTRISSIKYRTLQH